MRVTKRATVLQESTIPRMDNKHATAIAAVILTAGRKELFIRIPELSMADPMAFASRYGFLSAIA